MVWPAGPWRESVELVVFGGAPPRRDRWPISSPIQGAPLGRRGHEPRPPLPDVGIADRPGQGPAINPGPRPAQQGTELKRTPMGIVPPAALGRFLAALGPAPMQLGKVEFGRRHMAKPRSAATRAGGHRRRQSARTAAGQRPIAAGRGVRLGVPGCGLRLQSYTHVSASLRASNGPLTAVGERPFPKTFLPTVPEHGPRAPVPLRFLPSRTMDDIYVGRSIGLARVKV